MGQPFSSKKRHPHLDDVLVWTIFVKKQKWALTSLPVSHRKGTIVTQGETATGTLSKTTSQRSTKFVINVHHGIVFNQWQDLQIGSYKISANQLVKAVSRWYPRLLSQSHMTHEEIYVPPSPRKSTIDIKDSTVTSYSALDLAESKGNRRSRNLRKILAVELDNRDHDHQTSVTSGHIDSLHHQKKLNAVKKFFGEDRKLFYISVEELEQVVDDAGIGHLEYTQTMGVEGIPMNTKQRKEHPKLQSIEQLAAIKALLAEIFQVMSLHVHVLNVRENLETVENPPPKKLSFFQRLKRLGKKKVKLRRSEVDYMISTRSGPPSMRLEALQRLLVKVGQKAKKVEEKSKLSDESSSDSDSDSGSGGSDSDDGNDSDSGSGSGSDSESSSDDEDEDEDQGVGKKNQEENEHPHVEVQYTDGGEFANVLVDPLGDLVGLLDQDAEHPALIVAHVPIRKLVIPLAGFTTRKAALLDAFGSYLTKKEIVEKEERRFVRKQSLRMKMGPPTPKRLTKKENRRNKGTKYAVVADATKKSDLDDFDDDGGNKEEDNIRLLHVRRLRPEVDDEIEGLKV